MVALTASTLLACSGAGLRPPEPDRLALTGTAYAFGAERTSDVLPGTRVSLEGAGAPVRTTTDGAGLLSTAVRLSSFARVTVGLEAPGFVPLWRAWGAQPGTALDISAALEPWETLDCSSGTCSADDEGVSVSNLPGEALVRARALDPATLVARPGGLEALEPLVLLALALELPDADGGAQEAPAAQVRLPFSSWRLVVDAQPASGRIELPLWRQQTPQAQWEPQGTATLLTEAGLEVPEAALPSIRARTFSQGVVAQLPAQSGLWAIASPAQPAGCLVGLAQVDGAAAAGVALATEGREPVASSATGFCIAAPLAGSVARTDLAAQYAQTPFTVRGVALPVSPGTCARTSSCQATPVELRAAEALAAQVCSFSGTVTDGAGVALGGAVVVALDGAVPGNAFNSACGRQGTRCTVTAVAGVDGRFSLKVPVLRTLALQARAVVDRGNALAARRAGRMLLEGCPTSPVELPLREGTEPVALTLSVTQGSLGWQPARQAWALRVVDSLGATRWEVVSPVGLSPPLAYGVVPSGASQRFPAQGAPTPLAAGDSVSVQVDGVGPEGVVLSGGGALTLP